VLMLCVSYPARAGRLGTDRIQVTALRGGCDQFFCAARTTRQTASQTRHILLLLPAMSGQTAADSFETAFDKSQRDDFFALWLSLGIPFTVFLVGAVYVVCGAKFRISAIHHAFQAFISSFAASFWASVLSYLTLVVSAVLLVVW